MGRLEGGDRSADKQTGRAEALRREIVKYTGRSFSPEAAV